MSKKSSHKSSNSVRKQPSQTSLNGKAEFYKPWVCKPGRPAIVKTFLQKVGLVNPVREEEDYEDTLLECYGFTAGNFLQADVKFPHGDPQTGALMSANLEFATAIRSHFDGQRYEEYFSWLTRAKISQPRTIIDLGCDIGITTCFYATLFPKATITGIDR